MTRHREAQTLRRRLVLFISWPMLVVFVASMVADYRSAVAIASDAYDNALVSTVVSLVTRLERDDDDLDIEVDVPPAADAILRADTEDRVEYLVFDDHGKVVAGDRELLALPRPTVPNRTVLRDLRLSGVDRRVASFHYVGANLAATVVVAETTVKRARAQRQILVAIVWPNLLLLVVALLLVYFGVHYALRPLDVLGARIGRRGPGDFSPLPTRHVPGEAVPFLAAINRLMGHLDEAGQAQQAFLSTAAHQLRTPLAGLQTQLELAADDLPPEARPRIARLHAAARRLSHVTHQMLALARSSSEGAMIGDHRPVDLAGLLEDAASDLIDPALEKRIDLGFEPAPAMVEGSRWMLREMVANLLENAIAYTPEGGQVTARCGVLAAGAPFVEVEDDGPGIPPEERQRVFERFYRVGGSGVEGTGLGLAIVKEVADRHGATIVVDAGADGRGTRIQVAFLPPDRAHARS